MIPYDELTSRSTISFAPMVDFLFIVIAVFAFIIVSKKAFFNSDLSLVKVSESAEVSPNLESAVDLSISSRGKYKIMGGTQNLTFDSIEALKQELKKHQKTQILLHIDKQTEWQLIATLIYSMNQEEIQVYPVYEKK